MQDTVKGGRRRQGRQKKKLEDNTREWRSLEFAKSKGVVENGEKWRKLAVKSSVGAPTTPTVEGWVKGFHVNEAQIMDCPSFATTFVSL